MPRRPPSALEALSEILSRLTQPPRCCADDDCLHDSTTGFHYQPPHVYPQKGVARDCSLDLRSRASAAFEQSSCYRADEAFGVSGDLSQHMKHTLTWLKLKTSYSN